MRKSLLLFLLSVCRLALPAQDNSWLWADRAGGNSDQQGNAIASDTSGNIYVTGFISGASNTFGNISLSAAGSHDIFVAKYSPAGNIVWSKSAGGSSADQGMGIAADAEGNVYVCGSFQGNALFYGLSNVALNSSGGKDIFIAKYDPSGNVLWAQKAGGSSDDGANAVCITGNKVFITGYFSGSASFGTISLNASGNTDGFIASYDAATGLPLWAVKAGSGSDDEGTGIASDGAFVYATGTYKGAAAFSNMPGSPLSNSGGSDAYLVKYDLTGNGEWKKKISGSSEEAATSVVTDGADVYVGGHFRGAAGFYDSGSSPAISITASNSYDGFLAKYNSVSGSVQWASSLAGSDEDQVLAATIVNGNIAVTGWFKGTLQFPSGPVNASDKDVLIAWLDAAGNVTDGIRGGGSNIDAGLGITAWGNVVSITGLLKSSAASFDLHSIGSIGNEDILLARAGCSATPGTVSAPAASVCKGSSITLTASGYSGSIQWQSSIPGSGVWTDIPGANSPTLNAQPVLATEYRTAVTKGSCMTAYSNAVVISTADNPVITLTPGNATICEGDTVQLTAAGAAVYTWSPAVAASDSAMSLVKAAPGATVTYTVTGTDAGGCSGTSAVTVTVNPKIASNDIVNALEVCSGDAAPTITGLQPTGGTGTYTLLWEESANGSSWAPAQGMNDQNNYNPGIIASSTYYRRKAASGACSTISDTSLITIKARPTAAISGSESICPGDSAIITLSLTGSSPWSFTYSDGTSSNTIAGIASSSHSLRVSPSAATAYTPVSVTDSTGCTGSVSGAASVAISPRPSAQISGAEIICSGDTASIDISLSGSAPWMITYSNGTYTYTINSITDSTYTINVTPGVTTVYTLVSVSDSTGCAGGAVAGSATIIVHPVPAAYAGDDASVCGLSINLNAASNGTWSASPAVSFNDPNDPRTGVTLTNYGSHTLVWTETNGVCSKSDSVTITAWEQPQQADAGNDIEIYFGTIAELSAQQPSAGTGSWSIASGAGTILNPASNTTGITGLAPGTTVVAWTVSNGACAEVSDEITIKVHELLIPSGFSPNDDNSNDRFFINGIDQFGNTSLSVFNRWGEEVYSASPYTNEWNGYGKEGAALPDDTYFYVLKLDEKNYSGYVIIKRK